MDLQWGDRRSIDVDGVGVHVEEAGPTGTAGSEPSLALLHGFASGTFTWAGVAPGWADRHRIVAWDRPPFGRSDRPRPARGSRDPYRKEADHARARAVLAGQTPGPVVLVGHSAGTVLATELARSGHLDVVGVVLLAPALSAEPPVLVRRMAALPGAGLVGASALRVAMRGAGPLLNAVGRHRTPLLDATAEETARLLRAPGTATALWHLTRTWTPPATDPEDLAPLDVPTLVIGGADDRISTPTATTDAAERLGARLHLLDDVGHAPQEQVPEVVGPLIGDFVESIGRAPHR